MVAAAGGSPKIIPTNESTGFKLTPLAFRRARTKKTKVLILNSPSNPTGAVYTRDELAALGEAIYQSGIYVLSDEIYDKLVYGEAEHFCLTQVCPNLMDRAIIVNGVSKTYAMTGWRLGWALGPKPVIAAMINYQSHLAGNTCSIAQWATLAAVTGDQSEVEKMRQVFDQRRQFLVERVKTIPHVKLLEPRGAFYAFINIKEAIKKTGDADSKQFAMRLLEEKQVAAVPGADFGAEGYIRFSYATSKENIAKGLDRLEAFVTAR
jgi:aspartate aminotransferase